MCAKVNGRHGLELKGKEAQALLFQVPCHYGDSGALGGKARKRHLEGFFQWKNEFHEFLISWAISPAEMDSQR